MPHISEKTPQGVDKVSRYNWMTSNKMGELAYLPKSCLNVDPSYQRDPKNKSKILDISRNWNWISLAAIVVARRSDGTYWVVDGQHRVLAAKTRSDIDVLPCVIHGVDNIKQEAEAFLETNVGRKPMMSYERHKAAILANDPVSIEVQRLIDEGGKRVVSGGSGSDGLKCIGTMNKLVKTSHSELVRVWPLICRLTSGIHCSDRIIQGLVYIEKNMIDGASLTESRWEKRILAVGNDDLLKAAAEGAAFFSAGGAKAWAIGMVNRINKGLSKKLEIKQ